MVLVLFCNYYAPGIKHVFAIFFIFSITRCNCSLNLCMPLGCPDFLLSLSQNNTLSNLENKPKVFENFILKNTDAHINPCFYMFNFE